MDFLAKSAKLKFTDKERKAAEIYPFLASGYYLGLIGKDRKNDPVFKQCFPDERELHRKKELSEDPLAEERQTPVSNLIHRYKDRVVLLVTNKCAVHCRFCFRKRKWKNGNSAGDISDDNLQGACKYISRNTGIREVLVSGGDPLMLPTPRLKKILDSLSRIKNIDAIRIGTRIPAVLPMRIDKPLVNMLSDVRGLWIMTHFNHPSELTRESEQACLALVKAGIPLLNQTVLLKGVNDNAEVLEELFRGLVKIKVKPHYLFHADPVEGSSHFRTGIRRGLEIMRKLRPVLSSLGTPVFAIDLPDGGGKVPLQADYRSGGKYSGINGKKIFYS
ncbi:MAG: KamA family radical SAM protein [Victivallales bacterium]